MVLVLHERVAIFYVSGVKSGHLLVVVVPSEILTQIALR